LKLQAFVVFQIQLKENHIFFDKLHYCNPYISMGIILF
jgi:hypothetical protein